MPTDYQYDVFLSYRKKDPDKAFAHNLLKQLEADGYKVAIDVRDFAANRPFLQEMERCVRESRFTAAIVTAQYLESGNTEQETILSVVQDMNDRQRRLIPLVLENVQRPPSLFILAGVDYTDPAPLEPPYDKLKRTLGRP